jgi:glycosyltransferase involved in cell wall biosynthesis
MTPRITVAIPAFRRTEYLNSALESVLNQESKFEFEVILTLSRTEYEVPTRLLRKAEEKSVRFRLIDLGDCPVRRGESMLSIARAARGDILAILDDDDTWLPGKILRLEEAFAEHARLAYFHNGQDFIDASGRQLPPFSLHRSIRHPSSMARQGFSTIIDAWDEVAFRSSLQYELGFNNSSIGISRSLLLDAASQLAKVSGGEDGFLFCLGAARGRILYMTTDHLTGFRIHPSNTSSPQKGTSGTSEALASRYRQFVQDQELLGLAQLYRSLLPVNAPGHFRAWIDRDQAVRIALFAAAGGDLPGTRHASMIRALLDTDALVPLAREIGCAVLLMGAACARKPTLLFFMSLRKLG